MQIQEIKAAEKPVAVVSRDTLTKTVDVVKRIIPARSRGDGQEFARIKADGERLLVNSCDADCLFSVSIPAAVDSRLDVAIDARTFSDFLKKATASDFVEIRDETSGDELSVALDFERVAYTVNAFPVAELPTVNNPESGFSASFTLPGSVLWDAFGTVAGAMSPEETRYYLNGMFIRREGDTLAIVATDGHRLYLRELPAPEGFSGPEAESGVIIPRVLIGHLLALWKGKNCPDEITVQICDWACQFSFQSGEMSVSVLSKLVDGTFPDYRRVMPRYCDNSLQVDAGVFAEAARSVALVSSQHGRAIKLTLTEGERLNISAQSKDKGKASAHVNCTYAGTPIEIGFNSAYVQDIIANAAPSGGLISIALQDYGSPVSITGPIDGLTCVLMPIRV